MELQVIVGTIMIMNVTVGNFIEVGLPLIYSSLKDMKFDYDTEMIKKKYGITDLENLPETSEEGFQMSDIIDMTKNEIYLLKFKYFMSDIERVYNMPEYDITLGRLM